MDPVPNPLIRDFEICRAGVAVDGRGIDNSYIETLTLSTKRMLDPKVQGIKPPLRPWHDRIAMAELPNGEHAAVQTGADNTQKACGVLLDVWMQPCEDDPLLLSMRGRVQLTPEAALGFDTKEYLGISIGSTMVGFSLAGNRVGEYINHIAVLGVDPPAFPGLQLSADFSVTPPLPEQKKRSMFNKKGTNSNKISVTLNSKSSEDLKMGSPDYKSILTKFCTDMMKMMEAESAPPGSHEEPDGDEAPPAEQPAEDKNPSKEETEAKMKAEEKPKDDKMELSGNANFAALQSQLNAQAKELQAIKLQKIDDEILRLKIPQDKRETFKKTALTAGLDNAVALAGMFSPTTPPHLETLPGKAPGNQSNPIETQKRAELEARGENFEVNLNAARERFPHLTGHQNHLALIKKAQEAVHGKGA